MKLLRSAALAGFVLSLAVSAAAESNTKLDGFRRQAQRRLAEAAFSNHDIDAAQSRLETALELAEEASDAPELGAILERLGDISLRRNQLRTAEGLYRRALEVPREADKGKTLTKLARVASRAGRHTEAAQIYERALDGGAKAYLSLGEAWLRAGQPEQASEAFEEAVAALDPGSLELAKLHETIARRYLWLVQDSDAAAAHEERALEIRRGLGSEQLGRVLRSRAIGAIDDERAEEYLAELPTWRADQIDARRLEAAGELEEAFRQQLAAVNELRKAPARASELAVAMESLAGLQAKRGSDAAAMVLLAEALALRRELGLAHAPRSLATVDKLASTLEREGQAADAEKLLHEYLTDLRAGSEVEPLAVAATLERLGDLLLRKERTEEAAQRFQEAVQIREEIWGESDGRLQPVLEKQSDALRRLGREEEARGAESQLALMTVLGGSIREPPQGRRDTGTWLSEPSGISFVGLALAAATLGLVWLGWSTVTKIQPGFEASLRPPAAALADAPGWKPVPRVKPTYPVSFTGRGGPLFGIWSVNMALTLITLGLYFFWAKIRTRRYFWGQAELAGDRFTFRGTGGELLIGWMKAAPFLALLLWGPGLLDLAWESPNAGLWGAGIAITLLGVLWPLAEIGANRYRLSRTSWRAIRFSFRGGAWPYMKLWLWGMLLWIVTLGLWAPFFDTARRRYLIRNMQFGDAKFTCDIHGKDLVPFYLVSWVLLLPTLGASHFWYKALSERYYWSRTQLVHNDGLSVAGFECSLKGLDLLVLWIQQTAMISATLGLGWPWTRIWEARLRLQTLSLTGDFRPGRIRQSTDAAGAAGEGAADFLSLDFGFFA